MTEESKRQARERHRKELVEQGIKIGTRKPQSAKAINRQKFVRTGICMVCKNHVDRCTCDDRSEWVRKRLG